VRLFPSLLHLDHIFTLPFAHGHALAVVWFADGTVPLKGGDFGWFLGSRFLGSGWYSLWLNPSGQILIKLISAPMNFLLIILSVKRLVGIRHQRRPLIPPKTRAHRFLLTLRIRLTFPLRHRIYKKLFHLFLSSNVCRIWQEITTLFIFFEDFFEQFILFQILFRVFIVVVWSWRFRRNFTFSRDLH